MRGEVGIAAIDVAKTGFSKHDQAEAQILIT